MVNIIRINELPEGSGNLSNDDLFVFMDDPSGSGVTKKISLSQISAAIGGGNGEGGNISLIKSSYSHDNNTANLYGTENLTAVTDIDPEMVGTYNQYEINLPFPVNFNGQSYNSVWLHSFGAISFAPLNLSNRIEMFSASLNSPTIFINANVLNLIINYYYGSTEDGRFIIRYEAAYDTGWPINFESDAYPTVCEIWFYDNNPNLISMVSSIHNQIGGAWGIKDTTGWTDIVALELPKNKLDIDVSSPQVINSIKFIGAKVDTHINNNEALISIDQTNGLNISSSSSLTTISSKTPILEIRSDRTQHGITLSGDGHINLQAYGFLNDANQSGDGGDINIWAGAGIGEGGMGGDINIAAGNPGGSINLINNGNAWGFNNNGHSQFPGKISFPNGTSVAPGTFDSGMGGNGGISLNCVVGYELNWQASHLKNTIIDDVTNTPQTIYFDSPITYSPATVSLVFNTTIAVDCSTGEIFDITLTDNILLDNPINAINGKTIRFRITQDATGNRTVTLGSKFNLPSSATSPLPWSSGVNKMDVLAATYHEGRDKWDVVAFVPGY